MSESVATPDRTWLVDGVLVLVALAIAGAMLYGFYALMAGQRIAGCVVPTIASSVVIAPLPSGS